MQQTVTTACHHCLEPACLNGCPVKAYEKDPVTGIVKHLDDQCIGCQYCVFMCPYDAPKFNKERGIVRKCDMCSDRLAHGEAPACVQSCPNEAIRITLVQRDDAVQATEANALPARRAHARRHAAHDRLQDHARPSRATCCRRTSTRSIAEHAHLPLVVMLTLTQLSVGAFIVDLRASGACWGRSAGRGLGFTNALFALALALAGDGGEQPAPRPAAVRVPRGARACARPG